MEPTGNHDAAGHCHCVTVHRPVPLELANHRILPGEYGGTYVPENVAVLCPTTHANVHELLRAIVRAGGWLPWSEAQRLNPGRSLNRYAFTLAHEGWRRMQAASHSGG